MTDKSIFSRLILWVCLLLIAHGGILYLFFHNNVASGPLFLIATLIFIVLAFLVIKWRLAPLTETLSALDNGINALKDHDFSLTLHNKQYVEVTQLITIYNELTTVLRNERMDIFQRELLLDTVIQSTPVSLILTNSKGSIVYSNLSAKKFLKQKNNINGGNFYDLVDTLEPELRRATLDKINGLLTIVKDQQSTIFNVNCRQFMLNGREHNLYLYKNMTAEISQKEIDLWKQVIRLISHELNNSLAPIASLTRSASKIIETPEHTHLLHDVLNTIGNRTKHLHEFISQYAEFARLPKPKIQKVVLQDFIHQLATLIDVPLKADIHSTTAAFDAGQIEQVVINLIKNALESGSDIDAVGLDISQQANLLTFSVFDRGEGLTDTQMQQALLPFFTTKNSGSGIGLALCNDVVNNHGGKLTLANRKHGGLCVSFSLSLISSSE